MANFASPRGPETFDASDRIAVDWKRGCLAPLLLASSLFVGSLAAAETPESSSSGQITPQQSAVMEHLRKLYKRDGREMPSMRIEDAPLTSLPPGMRVRSVEEIRQGKVADAERPQTVKPVQGTEDSGGGLFALFGQKDENASPKSADSPSFLDRLRNPFHRSAEKPAERESLFGRMLSPFRNDEPATAADQPTNPLVPPAARSSSPFRVPRGDERQASRNNADSATVRNVPEPHLVPLPQEPSANRQATRRAETRTARPTTPSPKQAAGHDIRTARRTAPANVAPPSDQPIEDGRYITLTRKFAARRSLVGMQGYCPVALREQRRLVDARGQFLCVYQGRTYEVSSAAAKARFDANPVRYAPAQRGHDVVLREAGRGHIDGKLVNAVWFQDRLYLFRTAETARQFRADPMRYVNDGALSRVPE